MYGVNSSHVNSMRRILFVDKQGYGHSSSRQVHGTCVQLTSLIGMATVIN